MPDKSLQVEFGQLVRDWRLQAGLSQEGFAYRCGIHRTYMTHIEGGTKTQNTSFEDVYQTDPSDKTKTVTVYVTGTFSIAVKGSMPVTMRMRPPPATSGRATPSTVS